MNFLVTGVAGFIGYFVAQRLLAEGHSVFGIDNLNDYYDVTLKEARLRNLSRYPKFAFSRLHIEDPIATRDLFKATAIEVVIHLAAQAGVRASLTNPAPYIQSNLVGFANILEGCREIGVRHLVFASSSSVYGTTSKAPFRETDSVDKPVSLYAATKKANELMAHSYAHVYSMPVTGLRFFTVYGPWGRPDMAYFSFTKAILEDRPIKVFNFGRMSRDFTYIDDIAEAVIRVALAPPAVEKDEPLGASRSGDHFAPYKIFNIGNNSPCDLLHFIALLESCIGKKARIEFRPMQPGDVPSTYADIDGLRQAIGFSPSIPLDVGLARFVEWYKGYYA